MTIRNHVTFFQTKEIIRFVESQRQEEILQTNKETIPWSKG